MLMLRRRRLRLFPGGRAVGDLETREGTSGGLWSGRFYKIGHHGATTPRLRRRYDFLQGILRGLNGTNKEGRTRTARDR